LEALFLQFNHSEALSIAVGSFGGVVFAVQSFGGVVIKRQLHRLYDSDPQVV
jgi:hypothetical protein